MGLKERVYSVLVVSASERFGSALSSLLPPGKYQPVCRVSNISAAKRAATEREYDFVILHAPLPDASGVRFAIDASCERETVVLLLVPAQLQAEIADKTAEHGVFLLPLPTSRAAMALALGFMGSARERLRKSSTKALTLEEKMAEIRIVNRAKWLLIAERNMDEPQAHRYIEKQAMDRCVPKKTVAEEIIQAHS